MCVGGLTRWNNQISRVAPIERSIIAPIAPLLYSLITIRQYDLTFVTFRAFIANNLRWLLAGLVLTFFSSFGQTFFIGFFSGELRESLQLSHGQFGMVYMLATLASAISLVFIGKSVDIWPVRRVAGVTIGALALACVAMANAQSVALLLLTIYLLRLFGQGMMSHIAVTAMGKWYSQERGRAIAICTLGHQLGDGLLPIALVLLSGWMSWQNQWYLFAAVLLIFAMPMLLTLLQRDRVPRSAKGVVAEAESSWPFSDVLRDWAFPLVCLAVIAPSFIGTSVFFQQVHLREIKGWSALMMASAFTGLALTNMTVGLLSGMWVDRFSARQALPFFLLPLAAACFVLSFFSTSITIYIFMVLLGVSYGISNIVFGAIWAETYGTAHLGSIRSIATACMVLGSAVSPGVSGWLIDRNVFLDEQLLYMGTYCVLYFFVLVFVSRLLVSRQSAPLVSR